MYSKFTITISVYVQNSTSYPISRVYSSSSGILYVPIHCHSNRKILAYTYVSQIQFQYMLSTTSIATNTTKTKTKEKQIYPSIYFQYMLNCTNYPLNTLPNISYTLPLTCAKSQKINSDSQYVRCVSITPLPCLFENETNLLSI